MQAQDAGSTDKLDLASNVGEWAASMPVMLDGRPFTFERHEYLVEPYADDHPFQVEKKAAQLGNTTRALLRVLYMARSMNMKGIMYLFPSKVDVVDFSKSRLDVLVEENPATIGSWLKSTDNTGLKRVWSTNLYLRGMKSRVGLKSVPADFLVFDELDEAPQKAVDMAMERMGHSDFKWVHMLSNPTLPDYGIDAQYQLTDQRHWLIKCHGCGEYTDLVEEFPTKQGEEPKCIVETKDGRVIRACRKCGGEIDPSDGQWVAKNPSIKERRGYQYSQLFSNFVSAAEILHKFRTTKNLAEFYNLKIGLAYVDAQNRLSKEEVLALCGSHGIASSDVGPCSMGVDQGKGLHVVIGKRGADRDPIVHLGEYRDFEELDRLMTNFNVSRCVIDAMPEMRAARDFAKRFPGRVFLNFYQEHQKGAYAWNEGAMTVACNRTESLDASHKDVTGQKVVLPRECEPVVEFAKHLASVAKKLEEDEDTGSKRYVYVRLAADHYRHALNYEAMARHSMSAGFFSGCAFGSQSQQPAEGK